MDEKELDKAIRNSVMRMTILIFVVAFLFGLFIHLFKVQGFLISGSIYYICLLGFSIYIVKVTEKDSLKNIGVDFHNIFVKILLGFGICAILCVFQLYSILSGEKLNLQHISIQTIIIRTIYYICLVGFTEEFIFRGYLLKRLNELLNSKIYAVLLSSVIFAFWHYPVSYYFGQVIFAFFFGLILSTIAVKSKGNIIVSLAIGHGLYNALLIWLGYFFK